MKGNEMEKFARNLRSIRKSTLVRQPKYMTLEDLAAKSGVSSSLISFYENERNVPLLSNANKLANALGVTVDHLVNGDAND